MVLLRFKTGENFLLEVLDSCLHGPEFSGPNGGKTAKRIFPLEVSHFPSPLLAALSQGNGAFLKVMGSQWCPNPLHRWPPSPASYPVLCPSSTGATGET